MTPSHLEKLAQEYFLEQFRGYVFDPIAKSGTYDTAEPIVRENVMEAFEAGCSAVLAEALPLMREMSDEEGICNSTLEKILAFIEKWGDGDKRD